METKRRIRKNILLLELKSATNFVNRSEETINRLRKSSMSEAYTKTQIETLKNAIIEKNDLISNINDSLNDLSTGGLDDDINNEYEQNHNKNILDKQENDRIKKIKKEEKAVKKSVSKNYWNAIISESRNHRRKDRDSKYAYKYFNSVIDTLPSYMKRNLSEMPNNKGYIWRGVHFYGELREQRGPRVIFEKKRGGILVIHEYTDKEYRRYEKRGQDRKQLTHQKLKRIKHTKTSLLDYAK